MAKKKVRTRPPKDIERQVWVEAGFRCSVNRCDSQVGLQIHHIDRNPDNHNPDNLLLLCSNCHTLATGKKMDRKACRLIKDEVKKRPMTTEELDDVMAKHVARIEALVGRQERPEPFLEEQEASQPSNPDVEAAGREAIILEDAGAHVPLALLRALAERLYWSGDFEQALGVLKAVIIAGADAQDWSDQGAVLNALGRNDEAEDSYRNAVVADPTLAAGWYNLGNLMKELDRKEESEAAYRKALDANPKYARAWNNLGNLLSGLDRKEEAEDAYRKAVAADPELAAAWSNLGNILTRLGRSEEAETACRKAVAADPKFADAWNNLGAALKELGRMDEAVDAYLKAVEIDPSDADRRNQLAYFLAELGKLDEALSQVQEALRLDPKNCYANATMGFIYFENNDLERGQRSYEKALNLQPEDLPLQQKFCYEYGRALSRNGYTSSAREHLETAKRVDSTYVPLELIDAELAKLPE